MFVLYQYIYVCIQVESYRWILLQRQQCRPYRLWILWWGCDMKYLLEVVELTYIYCRVLARKRGLPGHPRDQLSTRRSLFIPASLILKKITFTYDILRYFPNICMFTYYFLLYCQQVIWMFVYLMFSSFKMPPLSFYMNYMEN